MMTAIQCPSEERLRALSLGHLPADESDDLIDHVGHCPNCQADLETIHGDGDSLIAAIRSPDEFAPFHAENDCQRAVALALGALSQVDSNRELTAPLEVPQQLGEYEIVQPLGRGGMGSVFLARHTKLGREVALKVLAHHRLGNKQVADRFAAEMRAVGRLSHPNIVTAYDAREVDGTAVLITEYIDGFHLGELIHRTGPLSTGNACEILRQIALALEYIDQQGFVHRDIKPSNIMLGRDGRVKLLDLGLARWQLADDQRADMTGTGLAMGTADFIAPEQATDSKTVDIRADIYSLGCTLFKLLTGFAPFEDDAHRTAFAKMTAHVSTPPPNLADLLPSAPKALAQLLASMLAKDVTARPHSPRDVAKHLSAWSNGCDLPALVRQADVSTSVPTVARMQSSTWKPQPAVRSWLRRRVPFAALVATGLVALGCGFLLGIIVTIKYPDGTVARHYLPDGSDITLQHDAKTPEGESSLLGEHHDNRQFPSSAPAGTQARVPSMDIRAASQSSSKQEAFSAMPLFFGIRATDAEVTASGFSIAEPTVMTFKAGDRLLPIVGTDDKLIPWGQIYGHVTANSTAAGVELVFDESLGQRMEFLTAANLQKELAIVLDGKVVAAPRIMSPVQRNAVLSGLKYNEIEFLMQALRGLVAAPASTFDDGTSAGWVAGNTSPPPLAIQSRTVAASNNEKQIALGLLTYAAAHRQLPASANRTASDGQPLPHPFSWRVAILPMLGAEEAQLYQEYHFDEPWDSEANLRLLKKMPAVYRSPSAPPEQKAGETNFVGFVGELSAFGETKPKSLADFRDGTSNSLLIIETKKSIPWTKPEDVTFRTPEDLRQIEPFGDTFNFASADGSAQVVDVKDVDRVVHSITIDGGESSERR